jgi:hypothetical protein
MSMSGWKTWVSAIGGFATGIGLIVSGVMSDPLAVDTIAQGLVVICGSGAVVGIGHKVEKQKIVKYVVKADELVKLLKK